MSPPLTGAGGGVVAVPPALFPPPAPIPLPNLAAPPPSPAAVAELCQRARADWGIIAVERWAHEYGLSLLAVQERLLFSNDPENPWLWL